MWAMLYVITFITVPSCPLTLFATCFVKTVSLMMKKRLLSIVFK